MIRRLDVEGALEITRRGLVAKPARNVAERLAFRL
jgi:hypothetical protein